MNLSNDSLVDKELLSGERRSYEKTEKNYFQENGVRMKIQKKIGTLVYYFLKHG
jgi:hypothetical protein